MEQTIQRQTAENYRLLIVDDTPQNIKLLAETLSMHNVEVSFASSGLKALDILASSTQDLILLDIAMPDMDGFEVCQILKSQPETKNIPIIFLTALTDKASILKGFEYGAVDYVTKPFHRQELLSRVFSHLELKRSRDQLAEYVHIVEEQNEQLREKSEQLEEASAMKDKIFSIVAHDLKNPFNTLIGFSEVLIEEIYQYETPQVITFLKMIHDMASKGFSLLQNFLEWSLTQSGKLNTHSELFDYHELIEDAIAFQISIANNKNIELINKIPKKTFLFADIQMVSTITRNLLSNALKFTNNGGMVSVSVSIADDIAEVTIEDTGIGISDEKQKTLFDGQIKEGSQGTNGESGTGLGLKLCQDFIEMNRGRLWVESKVGMGSKFKFSLPAQRPANFSRP